VSALTAVSLFAGVEGIGLALDRAGVNVTAAVEIDQAARGVISDRMPATHLFTDVTEVTADELRATGLVPERGIVTAGWPCQGNSIAGGRKGLADPRSGLWSHVVRLLDELRPRWFLGENVPGLLSVTGGEDFGRVLQDLADLGYGFAYRVLDAQFFGVPQRRRRVFIVGCLGDARGPVEVLLEPEGGGGNPPQGRQAGEGIAATLTRGSSGSGVSAPGRRQEDDVNLVVTALTTKCGNTQDDQQIGQLVVAVSENQRGEVVTAQVTQALSRGGGKPGQGYPLIAETSALASPVVRRLTPRECERLQGFPDDWTATSWGKPQADSARYRQMGNAVAVPCVEWVARRIVSAAA
jgi:DNA (cytosine-5)-methyltransferase 1